MSTLKEGFGLHHSKPDSRWDSGAALPVIPNMHAETISEMQKLISFGEVQGDMRTRRSIIEYIQRERAVLEGGLGVSHSKDKQIKFAVKTLDHLVAALCEKLDEHV